MSKKKQIQEIIINQEAAKWCFDKGYKIYPKAIEFKETKYRQKLGTKFKLVVEFGSEKKMGEKEYTQKEWAVAIWSVYNYLYNKHSGKKT